MKFIIEIITVLIIGVMNHALGTFFYIKNPEYPKLFTPAELLLQRWLGAISGIAVVLLVAINQPDGLHSVGIQSANNSKAVWIGVLAVSALLFVYGQISKLIQQTRNASSSSPVDTSEPGMAENIRYGDRWERLAYLTVLPLDVISEDLIYRGYFVLLLANKTGTFIPWAILSVILSVIIHLYQGRNIQIVISHVSSASFLVGLAIVTQNILAPISAHLFFNFLKTILFRLT